MVNKKGKIDIEKRLDREIKERKEITKAFTTKFEEIEANLKEDTGGYTKSKKTIEDEIEELRKMKAEITSYTLQLITIIVGIFALILTISIVALNKSVLNDVAWVIWLDIIFILILLSWFVFWLLKENVLHWKLIKRDGNIDYKKIISYVNTNTSDMKDCIESNNSHLVGYIESNNSKIRDYIDSKIKEITEFIKKNK